MITYGQGRRAATLGLALGALGLLGACTSTSSTETAAPDTVPPPQIVVVDTFAASPDEVKLDPGLSGKVDKLLGNSGSAVPKSEQETDVARKVASSLADKLVVEIRDLGLQAQRGSALPAGDTHGLLITGQLVSINEGSEAERVAIGLGAGRSDVRVQTQVISIGPDGKQHVIDEIEVDAKSGLTPGMAETAGAGALAGHIVASLAVGAGIHVASEELSTDVVADADRAAKGIAKQLAKLFAQQGWTL
jgi:hypothetical protein